LNRCEQAPVVRVDTPDGVALVERATAAELDEAIKMTCR